MASRMHARPTCGSIVCQYHLLSVLFESHGEAHIPVKHVAAITHKLQARGLQTWSGGEIGPKYDPGLVALSVVLSYASHRNNDL